MRKVARVSIAAVVAVAFSFGLRPITEAQETRRPHRIGVLHEAWAANHPTVEGLKAGLRALGFEEGRDVTLDIRFTEGKAEVMPAAAAAFVKAGVALIFTSGEAATQAARKATQKIPIVFTLVGDPVAAGIVKEVARPGGNVTGVSGLTTRLAPKRLEVLKALVPTLRRVWAIYAADDPSSLAAIRKAQEAALLLKLELLARPVRTSQELASALQAIRPGEGLLPPEIANLDIPAQILEASLSRQLPAVFSSAFWVGYGALMSYGADYYAEGLQAAWLVSKILQGAQPQELPVEGAHRIELVINLKTTKTLGVKIPQNVLVRADRMIQ